MKNISLSFYSVKRNEDAEPFTDNGLIAVADGLGGAGGIEHDISGLPFAKDPVQIKEKLLSCAIPEYNPQKHAWLTPYLDDCFKPLINEKLHTSAFWGARIAIVRFVFAMKEIPEFYQNIEKDKTREELSAFIKKGLMDTVKQFEMKPSENRGHILLPTTLAAIAYPTKKTEYIDIMWTGDSRCYVWDEHGLHKLTSDDIDWMGSLNNVFTAREDIIGTINYYRQYIRKPCILMTTTDGAFDPYLYEESYWMEAILLENIQKSKSTKELSKLMKTHYDGVKYDDASMACAFIGFKSFQDIKDKLSERTKAILDKKGEYEAKRAKPE